ncbi:MAG: hypothetical protein M1818_004805 [Claussenomyces sp. TS43310]|nr:MAG: hypothetical protein M1818_004805 [Claussenomyces sp. TS43310]
MHISLLDAAPVEILRYICDYLDYNTLKAFAFVSKRCRSVAIALLFRSIHISILRRKQLKLDVECWSKILRQTGSLNCILRLHVDGAMPRGEDDVEGRPVEPPRTDYLHYKFGGIADYRPPQETIDEDDAWRPLADFIQQLPAIEDLYYKCTNQFSPCLLEVLHRHRPNCRLHFESFRFRSLSHPGVDYHEFALATSPCLYSIATAYLPNDENHKKAVFQTVSRLAPNLKELSIRYLSTPAKNVRNPPRKPPWLGFSLDDQKTVGHSGLLRRLELCHSLKLADLMTWNKIIDFSVLRILKIKHHANSINRETLEWLAGHCPFASLKTLDLGIDLWYHREWVDYHDLLSSFMSNLPPLESLTLEINPLKLGPLTSILEHHGKSLRLLWLETFGHLTSVKFDALLVDEIRRQCPLLEDLKLPIPRSKGDRCEQAIYRTLGAISRLQRLSLMLDCSDRTVMKSHFTVMGEASEVSSDSSFDDFHESFFPLDMFGTRDTPRNGHVRDALINSALDETLARAIFQSISSGKGHNTLPLQCLQVCAYGGGFFGEPDEPYGLHARGLDDVIERIGLPWKLTRNVRDDCQDQVIVEKLDPDSFSGPGLSNGHGQEMRTNPEALTEQMEPVLRRLWPEKKGGSGDWRDEWHSFPLSDF